MGKIKYIILAFIFNTMLISIAMSQKKVSELTIVYDYAIISADKESKQNNSVVNATNTIYIKANLSRFETVNTLFSSITIHDTKTGSAVVLKEVSGQKLLIRMTPENWQEKNKQYEGISFTNTSETKSIAGYKCVKAIATTKTGSTLSVYYTKELIPENKEYDIQFKNLDGLPLEYELTNKDLKIKYTLSAINLNPVPASRFDIPKSGYREMTYEESKKNGMSAK